mmetsp:Transcript_76484/g.159130  ORF Transcript_76484/g.159130 Transcript_76484/m.159130 type:complete len:272 (-) Transcript_76484:754-1569(-)
MLSDHVLNFEGRDLLAGSVDDFLEAATQVQVAVLVKPALVSSSQPSISETLDVRVAVHVVSELVACSNGSFFDNDLALLTNWQEVTNWMARHDTHQGSCPRPNGAKFPHPVSWVGANGHGLGHRVGGHDRNFQCLLHVFRHGRYQCRRAVSDEFQLILGLLRSDFLRVVKHLKMHRRHCRIPRGLWICLKGRIKLLHRKHTRNTDNLRPCNCGGQHVHDEAMNVKERHRVAAHVLTFHLHSGSDTFRSASDIGVRQGNDLGLLRGARSVQH